MSLIRQPPSDPASGPGPPARSHDAEPIASDRSGELAVRGYAVTHPSGTVALPAASGWDQLLYASAGVMTVETRAGTWVIPPHRALWAPDGTSYRIVMHGRVSVRTLYLRSELAAMPGELRAVNVPPLLRELILHAVRMTPLDLDIPEHSRLVGVLIDRLSAIPQEPFQLPWPIDPRGLALAAALKVRPESLIGDLAHGVGAGRRTLERIFIAETGMSIVRWRQRLRLLQALELLADGHSATQAAVAVGYSTPSAFGAAFRDAFGTTPNQYFRA